MLSPKINLIKIPEILFILLPFSLITGPFLSGLSSIVIAFYGILYLIYDKNAKNIIFGKLFIIIFLFSVLIIISSLFSSSQIYSLKSSLFYFRFLLFSLGIYYLLIKNPKLIKQFFYSGLLACVILFIDSIFQFFYGFNLIGFEKHVNRISSFFGDELILGSYISKLIGIYIVCFLIIIVF